MILTRSFDRMNSMTLKWMATRVQNFSKKSEYFRIFENIANKFIIISLFIKILRIKGYIETCFFLENAKKYYGPTVRTLSLRVTL